MIAAVLIYDDVQLRMRIGESQSARAALEQRQQELQRELEKSRAPTIKAPATLAFLLLPPRRDAGQIPELAVPAGSDPVMIDLQLESDDFPAYDVALQNPAANQVIWRTASLKAGSRQGRKVISVSVPGKLLRSQRYVLAVSSSGPDNEPIGNYPFRVVFK